MKRALAPVALLVACAGTTATAVTPSPLAEASSAASPTASAAESSAESSAARVYTLDVTREERIKAKKGETAPPPVRHVYRLTIELPPLTVEPAKARQAHVMRRALWEAHKAIGRCWYEGPGKLPGDAQTLGTWLAVDKSGVVGDTGIDAPNDAQPWAKCTLDALKATTFGAAGDDVRVRLSLELQTTDVTGAADVAAPAASVAK